MFKGTHGSFQMGQGRRVSRGRGEFSPKAACWNILKRSLKPVGIFTTDWCSCVCDFIFDTMRSMTNSTSLKDTTEASSSAHWKVVRDVTS